ncbi:hypothetical protein AB0K12_41120 [Nonomuraea sp. NPDC049419]|uniref:hypothetical protein n=1 Tax=Nonomuraea sp. NPDC049419 TaxID=3155772 RepID=UPI003412AFE9
MPLPSRRRVHRSALARDRPAGGLVESVQRGMRTPAFTQGKIVYGPGGRGLSEHAVHHLHGLVLDAYRRELVGDQRDTMPASSSSTRKPPD